MTYQYRGREKIPHGGRIVGCDLGLDQIATLHDGSVLRYGQSYEGIDRFVSSMTTRWEILAIETLNISSWTENEDKINELDTFVDLATAKFTRTGLVFVRQTFPSSKLCSECGFFNKSLCVSQKVWDCPKCSAIHDRDVNAAINLKNEALKTMQKNFPRHDHIWEGHLNGIIELLGGSK